MAVAVDFDWRGALRVLFAGTVNQQTLEEAAELMVYISTRTPKHHEEYLYVLDASIEVTSSGSDELFPSINTSGYRVYDTAGALELLSDFRKIYVDEYERALGS